jgi:hypothetical protein
MRINSYVHIDVKSYEYDGHANKPKMVNGTVTDHHNQDRVEISQTGRELAADTIQHHLANYYGTAEIRDSLNQLLAGKTPEVRNAVSSIIQFNLVPGGSVANDEERAALLEIGLSQAKYLAENYMQGDEAKQFLATMNQIANLSKTGTTPPQKPYGAPDDYMNITDLMKRFEPDSYAKMSEVIQSGGDWSKILFEFAKKVPQNREWAQKYREETDNQAANLHAKIQNRYDSADTTNMSSFLRDMKRMIENESWANPNLLTRNLDYFAHVLGYQR